ncbi:hypothetical protein D3C85_1149900 [compost metagenome]
MHDRAGAALDAGCRRLLVNGAAERFHRGGFTQGQVQRVNMTAAHVEHAADILVRRHDFTDATLVHQLQLGVAEALPQTLLRFQVAHLLGGEGGKHTTILQVALDIIFSDAFTDNTPALEGHLAEQLCLLGADGTFDHVDVTAVAVDDLAAVAARSTETDLGGFEDRHLEAVLEQEQCTGEAGIARTDHAHVGVNVILQCRALRDGIGRCRVIRLWVDSVRHPATSV